MLEELLQDYLLGEHLLLVGNQGVGKNKLVDQLLFLLNRPREYIQLHRYSNLKNIIRYLVILQLFHRDTTVQALILQQKVVDGVVITEDSSLVRAAREGHVIIIDEADKAPTHVTCILKVTVLNIKNRKFILCIFIDIGRIGRDVSFGWTSNCSTVNN